MRRLLELPEIFGEPGHGGRGIEHDLGAVQPQLARPLGEVAVVADVDADLRVLGLEGRISEVAGAEVELLEEAGVALRDVHLAELAEVRAVRVDDGRRVVVDAGQVFLIHRHDEDDAVLLRQARHELRRRAARDWLSHGVPMSLLFGAEVRAIKELLQADDLAALARGLFDERHVFVNHRLLDRLERRRALVCDARLDQSAPNYSSHKGPVSRF